MKAKLIGLYIVLAMISAFWIYKAHKYVVKEYVVAVKVHDMFEQDNVIKHKHYSTVNGIHKFIRCHSEEYGWADIKVTTGTYMTTKTGDVIYFKLGYADVNSYFSKNLDGPPIWSDKSLAWMVSLIVLCLVIICTVHLILPDDNKR